MLISEVHSSRVALRWAMSLNARVRNIWCRHHRIGNPSENEMPESPEAENDTTELLIDESTAPHPMPVEMKTSKSTMICLTLRYSNEYPQVPGTWAHIISVSDTCSSLCENAPCTKPVNDTNNPAWSRYFAIPFRHFTSWAASESAARRVSSIRFDACKCGYKISNSEIEKSDTVMRCKVPGCETVWWVIMKMILSCQCWSIWVSIIASAWNMDYMISYLRVGHVEVAKQVPWPQVVVVLDHLLQIAEIYRACDVKLLYMGQEGNKAAQSKVPHQESGKHDHAQFYLHRQLEYRLTPDSRISWSKQIVPPGASCQYIVNL